MQAQSVKQNTVTANQSLQIVQTLLRAGFGCVAYLRGLLPDDNFTESHLNASSGISPPSSQESNYLSPTSVKLKTIKKGWSTEGDRLLQYLEKGIFDALEKQYLRSFIFAIYLDESNPENLHLQLQRCYCDVPGMATKVPIMTLNDQLDNLSLEHNNTRNRDPVLQAVHQGKQPTLNELKQSVKYLIRRLIAAVQTLNPLPNRRFVTFKLFYMDGIPDDYEPPYFQPGDSEKQYFFCTHSENEVPEKISIGSLRTPYHHLNLCVDSISDIIPQDTQNDDTQITQAHVSSETTQKLSTKQEKFQEADALLRKVVWNAERSVNPPANTPGQVNPKLLETGNNNIMDPSEQTCPSHPELTTLSPTQILETNRLMTPQAISSPLANVVEGTEETDVLMGQSCEVTTQALTEFLLKRDANEDGLSTRTQLTERNDIQTDSLDCDESSIDGSLINCDCGVHDEEAADLCQCDGPCQNWFHICCLGYHSIHDERLPSSFWCFPCRLRNDPEIDILNSKNLTSQYITKYKDLCLFRRAIKIVLTRRPENVSSFTKLLGTELSTAAQTWKRLETEGFIVPEIYGEGTGVSWRNKKQTSKKGMKRYKYIPARDIESSQKFKNYFDPAHETHLIGMSKTYLHKRTTDETGRALEDPEQTNPNSMDDHATNKRKNVGYDSVSSKRIKVSIAEAINLEE